MKKIFVLVLVCVTSGFWFADEQDAGTTVIQNVQVFNGERIIPETTVVFNKGKILAVDPKASYPDDALVIAGKGLTLLPGLFDAHVHVQTSATQPLLGVPDLGIFSG